MMDDSVVVRSIDLAGLEESLQSALSAFRAEDKEKNPDYRLALIALGMAETWVERLRENSKPFCAVDDVPGNVALRQLWAIKILREWNGRNYDARVTHTVHKWIDDGMQGPIPYPGGAFFDDWARENGLSNVNGFVGVVLTAELTGKG